MEKNAQTEKQYLCIDLKSFFASVECVERGLDPWTTNLVVADNERSDTTICLAVTPAMKKLGVKSRCRLYEIPKYIDFIKEETMKLKLKFKCELMFDEMILILLYKKIEKRGFKIMYNGHRLRENPCFTSDLSDISFES